MNFNNALDEFRIKVVVWAVIIIGIGVFVGMIYLHEKKSLMRTHVKLDVTYCLTGKRDTLIFIIKGKAEDLEIRNSKKSGMAVPELICFGYDVVAYDICWFNIIQEKEIYK